MITTKQARQISNALAGLSPGETNALYTETVQATLAAMPEGERAQIENQAQRIINELQKRRGRNVNMGTSAVLGLVMAVCLWKAKTGAE